MAALLPDYEYDIFISYRHNDSEWMAEFITRLQNELRTIIKQPLSIYYDKDPRDGLGDTHLVQASLDHRVLSSVILLPLVSMTYCDPERYSWQSEFLPFLHKASADRLGLNLSLPGGGVASRILPLRLHNLDPQDQQLLEQTLGGQLRSIDFVYPSPEVGVNRPLRVADAPEVGRRYDDQVNKVANAIKELVTAAAAKSQPAGPAVAGQQTSPAPAATLPPAAWAASLAPAAPAAPAVAAPAGPVVFLAWATSSKLKARREELALVCAKAGLRVVPATDCPTDEDEFRRRTQEGLAEAACSLHLLGNDFGRRFDDDESNSLPKYAYEQARLEAARRPTFRQFVWFSPDPGTDINADQQAFVSKIRNELTAQCTFSNATNAQQVVEDLRNMLVQAAPPPKTLEKDTDICFVFNALDSNEADVITDQLGEAFTLDMLTIKPDSAEVYKEKTVNAIPKSKLAVVYFKHSAEWALPFVKQVWQLVGGAASPTPILFLGEDDPEHNSLHSFKAPKVISRIQPHQGVSEEVQRVFQRLNTPA
ncbi:hypothetical protein ACFST9_05370 [Hymenobacter monticola]|uniref:TIR domain-containing protein n=1 Tax=Hymenobacter monticola TaxID=1705399 RepID=A0ABY4BA40_9BACT|nr:hypothetical protein [Hymenobacter monticola]UOE36049.1 hypothetical protein MTP16_10505 [Hymenobacter monticola]